MSKISKFVKVDKNVLIEYVYDSENNISESFDILVNSKDKKQSYLATSTSGTNNTQSNSLFKLDNISNKYAKINTSNYSFLQLRNYSTSIPTRHDSIKVHLPVNWTFGEYLGFYIRVYAYDTLNQQTYDLSNFYFDMSDVSQSYLLNYTSPPLLFQEKLWGKNLTIEVPALSALSSQRLNNRPKENSVNSYLTNGSGLSLTTPIFLDFHFITNTQTINSNTTYTLSNKISITVPQTPEFENLGLVVRHSPNGDFFEIYGTYNNTIGGFKQFIDDSYNFGHRYYVQYNITMYEQNIRGKTTTNTVTDGFNETIEYRPIIKTSTTTAIIDVEMRLIDAVDDSYIIRRASYGMLQDEVSRYSLNLIKINLKSANKPKIYNIKNSIDPSLVGLSNAMGTIKLPGRRMKGPVSASSMNLTYIDPKTGLPYTPITPSSNLASSTGLLSNAPSNISPGFGGMGGFGSPNGGFGSPNGGGFGGMGGFGSPNGGGVGSPNIQSVPVPVPVLVDSNNIISKSDSAIFNNQQYYGDGQIIIEVKPFDNIFKFSIATGTSQSPSFFDLTGFNEIKLTIKNDMNSVSFPLFTASNSINLKNGQIAFKIPENKFQEVKKIYNTGVNIFYIVGVISTGNFVIYSGLFKIFDSPANITELNKDANTLANQNKNFDKNKFTINQDIKLDPIIESSVNEVKPPTLTKATAPTIKPNKNKDAITEIKKNNPGSSFFGG